MKATDPSPSEAPAIAGATALGFALPAECGPGFAFNLHLLEQHWAVLRHAAPLIAEAKA